MTDITNKYLKLMELDIVLGGVQNPPAFPRYRKYLSTTLTVFSDNSICRSLIKWNEIRYSYKDLYSNIYSLFICPYVKKKSVYNKLVFELWYVHIQHKKEQTKQYGYIAKNMLR